MKILILHLSDIHISESTKDLDSKAEKIIDSVKNMENEVGYVFFTITGDLAFSGKEKEYFLVADFFDLLKQHVVNKICKNVSFILVPGNHDCMFTDDNEDARNDIINLLKAKDFKINGQSTLNLCTNNQDHFFNNCFEYFSENSVKDNNKLFYQNIYDVNGYKISFNCINTAWISLLKETEQYGKMGFPIDYLKKSLTSNFRISLFHHPLNWFIGNNAKQIKKYLMENSELVLTGHEHDPYQTDLYDFKGKKHTEYLEGGILNNDSNIHESSFNAVVIDIEKNNHEIFQLNYHEDIYIPENITKGWIPNNQTFLAITNKFNLSEYQIKWLNDPGATIYYEYSDDNLSLNDIFIYPELKKTISEDGDTDNIKISSETLIQTDKEHNRYLLIGRESIGKTTLLKKLFFSYYNLGYVPVYIEGIDIKETSPDFFRKLLIKCLSTQYLKSDISKIEQLEYNKFIIIIDDYHKSSLPLRYRSRFIKNNFIEEEYNRIYPNVIICGNDSIRYEELIFNEDKDCNPLSLFQEYEFLPLSMRMRYKLIEKWYTLRERRLEDTELILKIENAERLINSNLGRNFIPSYPLFILVHLHKIDIERETELKTSSYGYYFEYLIITTLSRIDKSLLDSYMTYLTYFAFYIYSNHYHEITYEEFCHFDKDIYRKNYRIKKEVDSIIDFLLEAGIIEKINSHYRIKYNYIYYYFIARYFKETLANSNTMDATKNDINNIVKELYKDENANILIFLTHLSKDKYIVDSLVSSAKIIFNDCPPLQLEDDCNAIENLIDTVPKLILETDNIKANRERYREMIDNGKEYVSQPDYNNGLDNEVINNEIDGEIKNLIDNLKLSIKTIQVLGQIGKNYHGSLTISQLHDVIDEAYLLGLRTVSTYITFMEDNVDALVSYVYDRLNDHLSEIKVDINDDKKKEIAKNITFGICIMVVAEFIKRIADDVGSFNLIETYREVYNEHDWNSVKLIDIAIKLDQNGHFPIKDVIGLNKTMTDSKISKFILKIYVKYYLEMYPTNIDILQKISKELGFEMTTLRLLANRNNKD